jgi:hypothetical protein
MNDRELGGFALAIALIGVFAAVGFTIIAVKVGEDFAIPVGIVGAIAAAIVLRGPLGKALARRIEGVTDRAAVEDATAPLVAHIEAMQTRLSELEERMEFTERVLTRARDADRLPG